MDIVQIALVFLILLLAIFLSILGFQVFFILRDMKKAINKLDVILQDAEIVAEDITKPAHNATHNVAGGPIKAAADLSQAVADGMKAVKAASKPAKKLFFRRK